MAICDECGCFDDNHAENLDYPENLTEEQEQDWLEEQEDYEPYRRYYWHGDIQEDYQMPKGYDCLCEDCFFVLPIIEKFEYGTNKLNPKWNDETMGWYMPLDERPAGTR